MKNTIKTKHCTINQTNTIEDLLKIKSELSDFFDQVKLNDYKLGHHLSVTLSQGVQTNIMIITLQLFRSIAFAGRQDATKMAADLKIIDNLSRYLAKKIHHTLSAGRFQGFFCTIRLCLVAQSSGDQNDYNNITDINKITFC